MKTIKTNHGYYLKHRSDNHQSWLKHPFLVVATDEQGFLAVEFSDATGEHPYNGDLNANVFTETLLKQIVMDNEKSNQFEQWQFLQTTNFHVFKIENETLFYPFFTKQSTCDTSKLYYFSFKERLDVSREYDFSETTLISTLTRKVVGNIQAGNFTIYPGNLEKFFSQKLKSQSQKLIKQISPTKLSNLFLKWHY
ncbi:hypothetical protein JN01_0631 [Entomoplasma freundtii]|uniref:Uncharacterized protein n=1 Tax=Entomoplasma freundtii TaxID=74700 RepID=A0A2K8NR85_9MOLU|nr:hypothetical protein [Entomoplasma freundtii]ATZ16329.1 hypothetical protein EFREU_v1c03030 [Entomoplasma freundtii]TDY56632.1 hypothetical protein JN01_0631 [Entomoplasma freundtii]